VKSGFRHADSVLAERAPPRQPPTTPLGFPLWMSAIRLSHSDTRKRFMVLDHQDHRAAFALKYVRISTQKGRGTFPNEGHR
jgi:hypothetical protein